MPADDGAEQRRGEEVEPAHARVAEVDLLQRRQRPGAMGDADVRQGRVLERARGRLHLGGAPHQVHVDADQDDRARARGSGRGVIGPTMLAIARQAPPIRSASATSATWPLGLPGDHVEHRGRDHGQVGAAASSPSARARPQGRASRSCRGRPGSSRPTRPAARTSPTPTTIAAAGPASAEERVPAAGLAPDRRDRDEHALRDAERRIPREQEHRGRPRQTGSDPLGS